jgi:hypothetical protein
LLSWFSKGVRVATPPFLMFGKATGCVRQRPASNGIERIAAADRPFMLRLDLQMFDRRSRRTQHA